MVDAEMGLKTLLQIFPISFIHEFTTASKGYVCPSASQLGSKNKL
jgi:hypothetical protein